MDTAVVDQALRPFHDAEITEGVVVGVFICPSYAPIRIKEAAYYRDQLEKLHHNIDGNVKKIVIPLCNSSHFHGYIVDLVDKKIIHVDSKYLRITATKRSVIDYLKEKYFPDESDDITVESWYKEQYQFDSHTCGAWLILGMVGYILGVEAALPTFHMSTAFALVMVLIKENSPSEIAIKSIKVSIYQISLLV